MVEMLWCTDYIIANALLILTIVFDATLTFCFILIKFSLSVLELRPTRFPKNSAYVYVTFSCLNINFVPHSQNTPDNWEIRNK